MDTTQIQVKDVIRARRFGRKTVANYVIDRIPATKLSNFSAYAHREYGAGKPKFMTFDNESIKIIRSYR